jgi:hypothetical protein
MSIITTSGSPDIAATHPLAKHTDRILRLHNHQPHLDMERGYQLHTWAVRNGRVEGNA